LPLTREHARKINQIIRNKFTHQEITPYLRKVLDAKVESEENKQMGIAVIFTQKVASQLKGHDNHHLIDKLCTKLVRYHEDILEELQKIQIQMRQKREG